MPAARRGPAGTGTAASLAVVSFSATPTFDATQGNALKLTLAGDVTSSTLTGAQSGQTFEIILCQDSTGGHSFAPPANVKWSAVGTTTANHCAAESFVFDGTTAFYWDRSPTTWADRSLISWAAVWLWR